MAGSSTCLNAAVPAPLDVLAVTHYPHVIPGPYTTETGINTTGAAVAWLAGLLYGGRSGRPSEADYARLDAEAGVVPPGADGVVALPVLGDGERTDPDVRGAFAGLSLRHDRAALARAVLEGVAFAIDDQLDLLRSGGAPVTELRVSGGDTRLASWTRIKADVLGIPVRTVPGDAAVTGVAMLAGLGAGVYRDPAEAIERCVRLEPAVEPDPATPAAWRRMPVPPVAGRWRASGAVRRSPAAVLDSAVRFGKRLIDACPARDQHLLRGEALATGRGLGADRPRPAGAPARPAFARPGGRWRQPGRCPGAGGRGAAAGLELHSTFTGLAAYSDNLLLHPDPAGRQAAATWFGWAIDWTAALGGVATGGHVGAFSVPDWTESRARAALWRELQASLVALSGAAHRAGLEYLLVENLAAAREPSTMAMIRDLLTDGDDDRVPVRLCLDVGHMCVPGTAGDDRDPYAWLRELAGRPRSSSSSSRTPRATTTGRSRPSGTPPAGSTPTASSTPSNAAAWRTPR